MKAKLHASIIVTYRCNARCNMCYIWKRPLMYEEEIKPETLEKLPELFFVNITGGEPFIRQDLQDIVEVLQKKSRRIVISTNGYFSDRIINICKKYPDIGIRISIEGIGKTNDEIRDIKGGFDRVLKTLSELKNLGINDIGFAMTVQDLNSQDIIPLYLLAQRFGFEFATGVIHNSYYFNKMDNKIDNKEKVNIELIKLINLLLNSKKPKEWARAYFNYGLINYINGNKRLLPCEMAKNGFFVEPNGDVLPCNGMNEKLAIGNIKDQQWEEIWNSQNAKKIIEEVKNCKKSCWMIGSVAPAIWQHPIKPAGWVLKNKIKLITGKDLNFC